MSDHEKLSSVEKSQVAVLETDTYSEGGSGTPLSLPEPTEHERTTLRRVLEHPKWYVYFICLIEFSERASYYGTGDRLNNFIQQPLPAGGNGAGAPAHGAAGDSATAGALGMGLQTATALNLLLTFLAYCFPLVTGYIADRYWSRMRMLWIGVFVGIISHVIFIIGALPPVLGNGQAALAPCVIGIITLAIATSFVKPVLLPTLLSQYPHETDVVRTLASGERVLVDRDASLQRMTMTFYWSINIGSFLSVATSYAARDIGYWLAFLIPLILYLIMPAVLLVLGRYLRDEPPSGRSMLADCCKVLRVCFERGWWRRYRSGDFWNYARPSRLRQAGRAGWRRKGAGGFYAESLVQDTRVTLSASAIFLYYVIYNINDGGIGSIMNSQTASLTSNGVPNDLISNFNPLCIIVFMPVLDHVLYPVLRKMRWNFKPVYRIFCGFMIAALASAVGAIIQTVIYNTSPCGRYATECDKGVSPVSMWVVAVEYALTGLSECLAMTTGYEIAFERSPAHMKSFVMALFLFTSALSAALGEIVTPSLVDPHLVIPFGVLAGLGAFMAFVFLWRYWSLDKTMELERAERRALEAEEGAMPAITSVRSYVSGAEDVDHPEGLEHVLSVASAAVVKDHK